MEANKLTLLDFLAQQISNKKARLQGYVSAPRWLVTNHELREECLKEATAIFEEWKTDELKAEISRKQN